MVGAMVAALCVAAPISIHFEGTLKQGLTELAERGDLNVIVVGDLAEPAQIHLTELEAAEALEAVATVYGLEVTRQGKLYVLRRTAAQPATAVVEASAPTAAAPPAVPTPAAAPPGDAQKELTRIMDDLNANQGKLDELIEAAAREDSNDEEVKPGPVRVAASTSVRDAVAFGGPVTIEPGARVTGDAVAFGGDVIVQDGAVIEGDAVAFGGTVRREGTGLVKGEQVSFGSSTLAAAMAPQAFKRRPADEPHEEKQEAHGLSLAAFLANFVVLFIVGFLFMVFAPQRMKGLESAVRSQPVLSGVIGMLALVALMPLTLFLVITLIGIPVAGFMWAVIAVVIPMGLAAIANTVGTAMPLGRVRRTQALVLAVGLLALMLLAQVPVLGPLMLSLAVCVSLGAVLRTRLGAQPKGLPITESVEHLRA